MFGALIATFQAAACRLRQALRDLLRPTSPAAGLARDAFRTRAQLLAENALLRQQLIVARRTARRPQLKTMDRTLMVLVSAFCRTWRDARACDFLQLYDVWFRPLFAFFIVNVNTKRVVRVGVTRSPSRVWVAQQLRNATPFGEGPEFIIRDRDSKFGADFDRVARGVDCRLIKCPVRSPLVNATCERFLGSVRRECLDHIVILGSRQLKSVLDEYVAYFNTSRPHQALRQRIPLGSTTFEDGATGTVSALPVLGGLHHDYRRAA